MRSLKIGLLLTLLLPLIACGDQIVGWPEPDETPPTITSTSPDDAATSVAVDTSIEATFSEEMDPTTLSSTSFQVLADDTQIAGNVTYNGVTATFNPDNDLDQNVTYEVTIADTASDLAGNTLADEYRWSFTTETFADTTRPEVTATTPVDQAVDVEPSTEVTATFTEQMDPQTITTETFTIRADGTPVSGDVTYDDLTATFSPDVDLDADTILTATVSGTVADLAGNELTQDYVWAFTTGSDWDTTQPRVNSVAPRNGATNVSLQTNVVITFSEVMDPQTITTETFTVLDGQTPVDGEVTQVGRTATFRPSEPLSGDTLYAASISGLAEDLSGNTLASPFSWSFTTGTVPDTEAPVVTFVSPPDGATAAPLNTKVIATFSEAMDPASLTEATFEVSDGGVSIPGTVNYAGLSATFTPAAPLDADTEYTATINTDVTDLSGNAVAADYVWSFTTGPDPDTQRPRVTSTIPADDETGVPVGNDIAVVFSEAMDPLTVTTANFTVQQGTAPVAGTVNYVGRTAIFNPTNPLVADTTYSVTVTTSAQDLAGNALSENYVWNFRTGAAPDTTRPRVISTIPDDLATDVVLDANVTAHFSEAMNPLTVTTATVTLENGSQPVTGTVVLVGDDVTFNPDNSLMPNTEYTATISSAATDLAGNALVGDYTWTFTTGDALDTQPPTVTLTAPEDLDTDVPLNASVNATFSEPMAPLTISNATFMLALPDGSQVLGTVTYDAPTMIATFSPGNDLLPNTTYTATVTTGVADLSGNTMAADYEWTFETGAAVAPGMQPVNMGSLTSFVAVAGAGLTNSNSSGTTILNGDVGLSPTATCVGDGSPCTITNPVINGTLYANDPAGVAALAKSDLTDAYNDAVSRSPGTTVNDITGMVLAPGVYTSGSTMSIAVGGTVTLDGQGDANSVFIFQIGSSLTVNDNARVELINGASAKNVFWAVAASSTLGTNVDFSGSVLAGESNSVGTDSVVLGRLLCTTGEITLLSNTITLPPL